MTKKIYIKYFTAIIFTMIAIQSSKAQDIDANMPRANDKIQKQQIEYQCQSVCVLQK